MPGVLTHLLGVLILAVFVAAPLPWSLLLLRRLRPSPRLPRAALAVLTIWCCLQAALAHLLGAFGWFRPGPAIAAEVLLLGLGAGALVRSGRGAAPGGQLAALAPRRLTQAEVVMLLALALMALTLLWWSAAMPVVDWDSWAFHMPPMADWLQHGHFTRMAQYTTRPRHSYPYGWEALCTLFLVPFGEDVFVTLPSLVSWILLGLGVYVLARQWGGQRPPALAAAVLLLAMPGISHPVNSLHVDLPFASMFVVAAAFGVDWARSGSLASFALGAAALGLACATRITGPVYAALLLAWVAAVRLRLPGFRDGGAPPRREPARAHADVALAVAGASFGLAVGAFWYGRNLIDLGHPFGNAAVNARADTWTPERALSITLAGAFDPFSSSSWRIVYQRAAGELDLAFVALALLAALCLLAAFGARTRRRVSVLAPALLTLGALAVFVITPTSAISGIQPRLGFAALAGLAVLAGLGASAAGVRSEVLALLVAVTAARSLAGSRILFVAVPLVIAWGLWGRLPARLRRAALPLAAAVALVLGTGMARLRREQERRVQHGPSYAHLERHARRDEPIAYLHSDRSYLLYGRWLQRPVLFAPIADGQSLDDWAEDLRRRGIGLLAVGPYVTQPEVVAEVNRLRAPGSPLVAVSGRGDPGEMTLFQVRAPES